MDNVNFAVSEKQMNEWNAICQAYAKKKDAELLFVNEMSCGLQFADRSFAHVYLDEMVEEVKNDLHR